MSLEVKQRGNKWQIKIVQEEWEMTKKEMREVMEQLVDWKETFRLDKQWEG